MKFRKKPVVIEAEQYNADYVKGICRNPNCCYYNAAPHVHTIHQDQMVIVENGDYIIPEPDGIHFYPCKPDIFEKTYESLSEPSVSGGEVEKSAENYADILERRGCAYWNGLKRGFIAGYKSALSQQQK